MYHNILEKIHPCIHPFGHIHNSQFAKVRLCVLVSFLVFLVLLEESLKWPCLASVANVMITFYLLFSVEIKQTKKK